MNCVRCGTDELVMETSNGNSDVSNGKYPSIGGSQAKEPVDDIGGFAELTGCLHKLKSSERQIGCPLEENLRDWGHHSIPETVPDTILQASAGEEVTFVFTNQVDGKLVPIESMVRTEVNQANCQNDQLDKENKRRILCQPLKAENAEFNGNRETNSPPAPSTHFLKGSTKISKPSPNSMHAVRMPGLSRPLIRRRAVSSSSDDDFA